VCHGEDGRGGQHGGGAALTSALNVDLIMNTVANGRNDMLAFGRVYAPEALHDLATYIVEDLVPSQSER